MRRPHRGSTSPCRVHGGAGGREDRPKPARRSNGPDRRGSVRRHDEDMTSRVADIVARRGSRGAVRPPLRRSPPPGFAPFRHLPIPPGLRELTVSPPFPHPAIVPSLTL